MAHPTEHHDQPGALIRPPPKPRGDRTGKPNPRKGDASKAGRTGLGVTPADYDRLVAAYRGMEVPDHRAAAEQMGPGWTEHRCKKVWLRGVPRFKILPARDVVADAELRAREHAAAVRAAGAADRAAMTSMVAEERRRAKAAQDAAKARAEEGLMVEAVRRNTMALGAATAGMMKGLLQLSDKVRAELEHQASGSSIDAKQAIAMLRQASMIVKFSSDAAAQALKMERLLLGDPAALPEEDRAPKLTPAQALTWIEYAARAVRRAQEAGVEVEGELVDAPALPAGTG